MNAKEWMAQLTRDEAVINAQMKAAIRERDEAQERIDTLSAEAKDNMRQQLKCAQLLRDEKAEATHG